MDKIHGYVNWQTPQPWTPMPKHTTHKERRKFRTQIANYVQTNNCTVKEASLHFKRSLNNISIACQENNVTPAPAQRGRFNSYNIIADLCRGNSPAKVLAKKYKLTTQRIHFIINRCRQAGIPINKEYEYTTCTPPSPSTVSKSLAQSGS